MIRRNQYPSFTLGIASLLSLLLLMSPLSLFSQDSSPPSPDFDGSGTVDIPDFLLFVDAFGSKEGDENYDSKYDLDGNGEIGVGDFLIFVDNFGKTVNSDNEGSTSGGSSGSSGSSGGTSPRDNPPTPPSGQQQVTPQVTISAGTTPVTEGTSATFTITASSAPTTAITVSVSVTEDGDVISGTPSSTVIINANNTTATLTVNTVNDQTDEPNSVVTAEVETGTGYTVGSSSSASVTVEDNENPTPAKRVEISPRSLTFNALGETQTVTVKVLDANGDEDEDASWGYITIFGGLSSGISTERVDGGIKITSTKTGRGRVDIFSDGAKTASLSVSVFQTPASLTLSPSSKSLTVGGTVSLSATIKDANDNDMQLSEDGRRGLVVYWETSDATVATVAGVDADEDGNTGSTATVTAVAAGTATITCRWGGSSGIRGTATITVTDN